MGYHPSTQKKMSYQDNQLAKAFSDIGNDVIYISNNQKYQEGKLVDTNEEVVYDDEVKLIRIKYKRVINKVISSKVRKVNNLYSILETNKPDIIYLHGLNTVELKTVKKIRKTQ